MFILSVFFFFLKKKVYPFLPRTTLTFQVTVYSTQVFPTWFLTYSLDRLHQVSGPIPLGKVNIWTISVVPEKC